MSQIDMFQKLCQNSEIKTRYANSKITKLLPWQNACLNKLSPPNYEQNLIFSAPTSAGKTLVSELLLQYALINRNEKVLFIVPMIATGEEKLSSFKLLFERLGSKNIKIEGYLGNRTNNSGLRTAEVAVCTIEKANQLINRLLKENRLHEIGLIIIDEIHMLGNTGRGYILELLLTKLLKYNHDCQVSMKNSETQSYDLNLESLSDQNAYPIQLLGMSATCPNSNELAKWLKAEYYETTTRPVELSENLLVEMDASIKNSEKDWIGRLPSNSLLPTTEDRIKDKSYGYTASLCVYNSSNQSEINASNVIVFRENRHGCISLAKHLAKVLSKLEEFQNLLNKNLNDKIYQKIEYPELKEIIRFGVAFHTASLSLEERELVENGFKNNAIKIIVATSTLASGVNLPAQRVIIRYGNIDKIKYHQMIGRAGRYGLDKTGESYLVVKNKSIGSELFKSKVEAINSQLEFDNQNIARVIMDNVVNKNNIKAFFKRTFYYYQNGKIPEIYRKEFENLLNNKFITGRIEDLSFEKSKDQSDTEEKCNTSVLEDDKPIQPTHLGRAALIAGLNPDQAKFLYDDLKHNLKKGIVLFETDLHIIYLVSSVNRFDNSNSLSFDFDNLNKFTFPRWSIFLSQLTKDINNQVFKKIVQTTLREDVSDNWVEVLNNVFMNSDCSGGATSAQNSVENLQNFKDLSKANQNKMKFVPQRLLKSENLQTRIRRLHRSYILLDICQEIPFDKICRKYHLERGDLLRIHNEGSQFAGMVYSFCLELGYNSLAKMIKCFKTRLNVGVSEELIDLIDEIPCLSASKARVLYDNGLLSSDIILDKNLRNVKKFMTKIFRESEKFDDSKFDELNFGGVFVKISDYVDLIIEQCQESKGQSSKLLPASPEKEKVLLVDTKACDSNSASPEQSPRANLPEFLRSAKSQIRPKAKQKEVLAKDLENNQKSSSKEGTKESNTSPTPLSNHSFPRNSPLYDDYNYLSDLSQNVSSNATNVISNVSNISATNSLSIDESVFNKIEKLEDVEESQYVKTVSELIETEVAAATAEEVHLDTVTVKTPEPNPLIRNLSSPKKVNETPTTSRLRRSRAHRELKLSRVNVEKLFSSDSENENPIKKPKNNSSSQSRTKELAETPSLNFQFNDNDESSELKNDFNSVSELPETVTNNTRASTGVTPHLKSLLSLNTPRKIKANNFERTESTPKSSKISMADLSKSAKRGLEELNTPKLKKLKQSSSKKNLFS